ncbi:hypothetical protein JMJ77_0006003 [Colletotrichum scovillei]|uniref:Uncharacterized protein n=1 Tax=Colletotrichum scovillei TaxID=1209932 RepID=A0A9P7UIT2_9PEZI|nr:hypothetical protein JMJ77_0006003 [Colletotrichum scovillei]KAG7077312.1 hypothetical protein JMJ76_0014560 [Colletotrichum scovillei]KAG7084313.1 hypothetical protein JMJ78_0009750 [Colletotrichum scovillei]
MGVFLVCRRCRHMSSCHLRPAVLAARYIYLPMVLNRAPRGACVFLCLRIGTRLLSPSPRLVCRCNLALKATDCLSVHHSYPDFSVRLLCFDH